MNDAELLRKKIKRLKKAQEEAEFLLEEKSRELYELNKNLENQVSERTKDFEEAMQQAIAANKAKSQFLANMSHEIRTPLNGMLGFLGLLEKSPLNETQKEQLSTVSKSSQLLLSIINDILEFSKIEAGKLEIDNSEFHLKRCIEDIVDVMANQVFEKNLEFPTYIDEKIPKKLLGDEARIRQILINLIGNAVKFTPSGEIAVTVYCKDTPKDGLQNIYFEVKDTGVGISKKKFKSIFSAFEQADVSDTRKYGGTGLGLTICQRMVEAMGGKLEVSSQESLGSTFYFSIPFKLAGNLEYSDRDFDKNNEVMITVINQTVEKNLCRRLQSWNCITESKKLNAITWSQNSNLKRHLIIDYQIILQSNKNFQTLKDLATNDVHLIVLAPLKEKSSLATKLAELDCDILQKPVKREDLFNCLQAKPKIIEEQISQPQTSINSEITQILLVEDNLVNQQVALAMLEAHGYNVEIANNGQEAVDLYDASKHQVILMDCQMPIMDGMDATLEIRKKDMKVPIIAMTANAFKKTKEQCFEVGMDDFITKPVNDDHLVEVINRVVLKKAAA